VTDAAEEMLKRLESSFIKGTTAKVVPHVEVSREQKLLQTLQSLYTTQDANFGAPVPGDVKEVPGWNLGKSVLHGMSFGKLPEIIADIQTPKVFDPLRPWRNSVDSPERKAAYEAKRDEIRAIRKEYGNENPLAANIAEAGGNITSSIPLMAAGAGALAPIGAGLTRAAPWTSGIVDFLSGAAGKTASTMADRAATTLPNNLPVQAASRATRGAVEGAAAGILGSGLSDDTVGEQAKMGAIFGAGANPIVGKVIDKFGRHITPTMADSAQALLDSGVNLKAGAIPGTDSMTKWLNKIFGGGDKGAREAASEVLTGKFAGLPAKNIDQGWVSAAKERYKSITDPIRAAYQIPALEPGFVNDLGALRAHAATHLTPENAKKLGTYLNKIEDAAMGDISGDTYHNFVQKGGALANIANDKDIAHYVYGNLPGGVHNLKEAFDSAWGRALPRNKKVAWDKAQGEYKVISAIDESLKEAATTGEYNFKNLRPAIEQRYGNVENAGELGKFARGAELLERPNKVPNKHGISDLASKIGLGVAALGAGAAGEHVINHVGPQMLAHVASNPGALALPAAGIGLGLSGAAGLSNILNSPRSTQYMIDVARGVRPPLLHGNDPILPFLLQGYQNKQFLNEENGQ
jgi:hypothetical protein